jgi:glyoxylase-like metal-dependent hydrolase (beta-lactamase superfamily II)/rhodanese-related sulfurtransferase
MISEQIYTNCLAQAAYYIESNGEAAIIDPMRDIEQYIKMADARGAKIKYILETHFHADFVSGHLDLAKATGAQIVYGPTAKTGFDAHIATDGEKLALGNCTIEVLHTPGHTPESVCFLLRDDQQIPYAVYTGDTLFVGDVGRPDLLDGVMTKEELAGMMYQSLNTKLIPLADEVIVYPGHGAGSACGKNIGKETFSTIGEQKKNNYALQPMDKATFVEAVTSGIAPPPAYFFADVKLNKSGAPALEQVEEQALTSLSVEEVDQLRKEHITILDTREADAFENGFIPGAINVGLNGQFAIWAATLLPVHEPIVLVCENGTEKEAINRLARVGFDHIKGVLAGGMEQWKAAEKRIDMVISIDPEEFALDLKHSQAVVLDVRRPGEYNDGHVVGVTNIPLADIQKELAHLDKSKEYMIHCAGGYRSMIAASVMKAEGFGLVKNVYGGYAKIKEQEVATEK